MSVDPGDGHPHNPINVSGMTTERMAGALVLGALLFLIAVRRGFRTVRISDASGGLVS